MFYKNVFQQFLQIHRKASVPESLFHCNNRLCRVELVEASKGNRLKCDNHILELSKKADKEPKILNCIKTFVHKNCMKSVMNIYFDFKFLLIA